MISGGVWSFTQDDAHLHCLLHNFNGDSPISDVKPSLKNTTHHLTDSKTKTGKTLRTRKRRQEADLTISVKKEKTESSIKQSETVDSISMSIKSDPKGKSKTDKCDTGAASSKLKINLKREKTVNPKDSEAKVTSIPPEFQQFVPSFSSSVTPSTLSHYVDIVEKYFRMDVDLCKEYENWGARDEHFALAADKCPGVRLLDQPPVENVFSFICSSNNNIARYVSLHKIGWLLWPIYFV